MSTSDAGTVRIERRAPVAIVWLDRPGRHNVLDRGGWLAVARAFRELSADDAVAAVAVRGAGGRAFSAGSDIRTFGDERNTPEDVRRYSAAIASAMAAVSSCRHPTVAIIEGICVGGGLEIAACCDLRICGESSRFGAPIHRLGLTMSHDELRPLLALLGPGPVLEILLTGELIDAERAHAIGLVNRVWPDGSVAAEGAALVDRIVAGAPLVNRWHKKFIRQLLAGGTISAEERAEADEAFSTRDYREGRKAFIEKRPPRFRGE